MKKRSSKELKRYAKQALEGRYGIAIMGVLAAFGINLLGNLLAGSLFTGELLPTMIMSQIFLFILSLVTGILSAGLYYMFLNMARDREFGLGDLRYFFRNHPDRVIVAGFVLALIDVVVSIPYYWYSYTVTPGNTLEAQVEWMSRSMELMLLSIVLNVIVTLPFVMTYFLMADDLDMGGIQALKASAAMMKGHKWRYLRMQISFIPLLFLSVFTLYIALLWIVPYLQMTVTMFYRDLLGELDQDIYGDYREDQDIYGHYRENEFAGDQDDFNSEA